MEKRSTKNMKKGLIMIKKEKPYLYYNWNTDTYETTYSLKDLKGEYGGSRVFGPNDRLCAYQDFKNQILTNGNIMAECELDFEEIGEPDHELYKDLNISQIQYDTELLKESGLSNDEVNKYLKLSKGYAIYLNNLKIFDEPKNYSDFTTGDWVEYREGPVRWIPEEIKKPFFGMIMEDSDYNNYILIIISAKEACEIFNGKQSAIIRKRISKWFYTPGTWI